LHRCFIRIQAEADADVLCRALNLFALQQLIPQQVQALRDGDTLSIEIRSHEQSWHRAQIIGEKLRNLISVFDLQVQPVPAAKDPAMLSAAGNSSQPLAAGTATVRG
jgi:hypothetical protein